MLRPHTSLRSFRIVLGALAAVAIVTPAASADTQRYASPGGADAADCSPANPCSITKAVAGAGTDDEVIVTPGDYQLAQTLATPARITIRGVPGQPRPRLRFSGAGQFGLALGYNSLLRYVEIDQAEQTQALLSSPARIDQVIVTGPGGGPCTADIANSIVRDSIFVAQGSDGRAICTFAFLGATSTSSVRNVTALATGSNGVAIHAHATSESKATINLVNVIARGGQGGADLKATDVYTGAATISATHSNYGIEFTGGTGDISNGGGNQLFKAPLFVNAAVGDYRQVAGSPTIDAGVNEPINGAFDFEGDPRQIGTMDIGADEFLVPPTATTGPAGAVTGQSATLSGSVTANAIATSYHFEYGPTAVYGNTTATIGVGTGLSPVAAAATLGGLSPATAYHYRIVATNAGGVTKGADQTFTTATPAPSTPTSTSPTSTSPTSTTPTPAATPPFAGVKLVSTRLSFAGRFIAVKLSCPAATVGGCAGRTNLTARKRRSSARQITLGRAAFSIAPDGRATVKVRVRRAGRRLLNRVPRLRGRAVNVASDAAGQSTTIPTAVTIRRRHH
jgi:hypothetical protein